MKVTVVGGGTAGYISALILKTRYPHYDISIIKSDKIGTIGVGEGTTEQWKGFIDVVGIDYKDLIRECDATMKGALMFENWGKHDYAHSVDRLDEFVFGQEKVGYLGLILGNKDNKFTINPQNIINGKLEVDNLNNSSVFQYHFNSEKLNIFFDKLAKERGIKVIIDEITEVEVNEKGISKIIGSKLQSYVSDFYIDSTGFKGLLIKKLGAKWVSYSKYLKMNEAIAFPTGDTDEYPLYTLSRAMDYGWLWRTPTYGRWGNGYIFDNNYINAEQAQKEVEKYLGHKVDVARSIKFNPGKIDKTWIKNCVAVGLSASFVEPLEATAISTSIQQIFLLTNYLSNYTEYDIIDYNKNIDSIMDNIRDFICLHYITKKNDTEFWKSLKDIDIPQSLSEKLRRWETRLPVVEDFNDSTYHIFKDANYIQVLNGLNLLNYDELEKRWLSFSEEQRNNFTRDIQNFLIKERSGEFFTHKKYLETIRGNNYD